MALRVAGVSRWTVHCLALLFALWLIQGPAHAKRLDVRAPAFDGGEVRYDGMYYDFRAANGIQHVKMWVPPTADPVRGVLFHGNPGGYGDTRGLARDRRLQEFAARHDFGIIGVSSFPGRRVYPELAEVAVKAMDDWGKLGYHPEIANLPIIARGSSNAGVTAYSLTCYAPERMICYTPNVGPAYNPSDPTAEALLVPGMLHVGPEDPFFTHGMEDTRELFARVRPRGARWAWTAEKGKGHEIAHCDDVDMKFYETCIALRLPPNADPAAGPVELRTIPQEDGWLVDTSSWDSGITHVAPCDEYEGDQDAAAWVPTADIAFLYRGVATHDNPLEVSVRGLGEVENPLESGVMLRSIGGNVVDPGTRLVVECDTELFPSWQKIEFYDGARKIGEVQAGQEPAVELVVRPEPTVYALTVLGYDEEGNVRTAAPTHFLVRDPHLSAALSAQHAEHDRLPPRLPRPPLGSSAAEQEIAAEVPAADPSDAVLVAYGLSPAEEKGFAVDGKVSAFWDLFGEQQDRVVLTGEQHLAERGETWESFGGDGDARMTVKAARSRAGLYLLFVVEDDQWAPPHEIDDAVDFHLARLSSQEIWDSDPAKVFVKPESFALVLLGDQFQVNLGTEGHAPTNIYRNFPDPWDVNRSEDELAVARERYGIAVDFKTLGPDRKALEMLIPWDYVGVGGSGQEPPTGTTFALSLGYNDGDPAQHEPGQYDRLRWSSRLDPWWVAGEDGPNPSPWGDLALGPMLAR